MSTMLDTNEWSHRRLDAVRLYILDNMTLKQLKQEVKIGHQGSEVSLTTDQWKILLRSWGIFKYIRPEEASFIRTKRGTIMREGYWNCLLLANGILLDIREVERYYKRRAASRTGTAKPPAKGSARRHITFVPMPFSINSLSDIPTFENFRRLLWFTGVHFDSCFATGIWSKDNNGLYGRSNELIFGLKKLSKLHNMLCDAFRHCKSGSSGSMNIGFALMRSAFSLNETIVRIYHHRQFSDILALALLAQREGPPDIHKLLRSNLCDLANKVLHPNDPRRHIFQTLTRLNLDSAGDLWVAFDTYCRHLWMPRAGADEIKAYYSYNQASFPRADTGQFYALYAGKCLDEFDRILEQVDEAFEEYSTARFVMWHTAIRYLLKDARHADAETISRRLCSRLSRPDIVNQCSEQPQLNVDLSLSFYLFGVAQFAQLKHQDSMENFQKCINTRWRLVQGYSWDPTLGAALEKCGLAAGRMGRPELAKEYIQHLQGMYSAVVEEDRVAISENSTATLILNI
ncbi:hypothetical protein BKA66DRAFT_469446 [Pyrenochaeta sp. MPI-SDFR-AT-0127]|nr:hypothetical protein BKA66DRAFT_469446 [Pyrenochaeta sp. MPI-SDFR-AT-0127]